MSTGTNTGLAATRSEKHHQSCSRTINHKRKGYPDGILSRTGASLKSMSGLRFTSDELHLYLYGQTAVLPVSTEASDVPKQQHVQQGCSQSLPAFPGDSVDILQLRYKPGVEREFSCTAEFNKVMHTIKTIPPQLHLCYSCIPGAGFGICAKQAIPAGTWIGPFEGKHVSLDEIGNTMDARQAWEIYKNGVVVHCIVGSDYGKSSWMKYVQCARHATEQNTVVFQFGTDIYFQTYKEIEIGEELLAWYAEYYEHYLGIPVGVHRIMPVKTGENSETATKTTQVLQVPFSRTTKTPLTSSKNRPAMMENILTMTNPCLPSEKSINFEKISSEEITPRVFGPEKFLRKEETDFGQSVATSAASLPNFENRPLGNTDLNKTPQEMEHLFTRFWKCERCWARFPQKWALHVHDCPCKASRPHECNHCGKAFIDNGDLQTHAKNCVGDRLYKCGYCDRSFLSEAALAKHLRMHSRQKLASGKKRRGRISNYEKLVQQKQL